MKSIRQWIGLVALLACLVSPTMGLQDLGQQGNDSSGNPDPHRVRVSQGVSQQLLLSRVPPIYPTQALRDRIQGVVVLSASISKEGDVEELKLVTGHPALAQAAIDAVKQWKYKPYRLNGEPVDFDTTVNVDFTLPYPNPR